MKLESWLIFACLSCAAFGKEVTISVSEITFDRTSDAASGGGLKTVQKFTSFVFDTDQLAVTKSTAFRDHRISSIGRYVITDRKLCCDSRNILPADRILYQCSVDGKDLVVIQDSHVSANPIYWFAALSGHPIQFGGIWVLSIDRDGAVKKSP